MNITINKKEIFEKIINLENENNKIKETINTETNKIIKQINAINEEKESIKNKLVEYENEFSYINIKINNNTNDINAKLEKMKENKIKDLDKINNETKIIYQELEELKKEKLNIYNEINALEDENNNISANIELINDEKKLLIKQIENIKEKFIQFEKTINDNKNELISSINNLKNENDGLKKQLDSIESEKNQKNKYYYNLFQGSKILTNDEKKTIAKMIKPYHNLKFRLLYQGSRDGFSDANFHSKCDYKGATVFIIVGNNGRKFGGFTPVSWNTENKEYKNENIFLFSLDYRIKFVSKTKGNGAIYCQSGSSVLYGPGYGKGDEFIVKKGIAYCFDNGRSFYFSKDELCGGSSIPIQEFEVYAVDNYVS